MPVKTFNIILSLSLLLCTNLVFGQADVSVRVEVENPTPAADELVYAKVFVTNEGDAYRNNLQVSLRLSASLFFVDAVTPGVTFDDAKLIWAVDQLITNETDSLRIAIQPNYGGVHTITAELTSADKVDWDSYPGNDRPYEDDQDQACFSVPVEVDCGQSLVLNAPRNQSSYTWYRNNEVLTYATLDTLHPTQSGEYRFEVGGTACASGNCCPVIVDRSMCVHDMALVASVSDISQSSAYQTITLTLYNQGAGAVSRASLYVTTSSFMRLKPGTIGWQLSGSRMTRDWTGMLQPGESTNVEFQVQAISGGDAADYQMFAEISAFYAGTTLLDDIDSSPDLDPTNDKVIDDAYLLAASEDEDDSDIASLTDCPVTTVSGNRMVCVGNSLLLTANANEPSATYNWSGSTSLSCTTCASPTVIVTEDIDLTLVTTTPEGCTQTQVVQVRVTNCVEDLLLITGLNDPDQTCFSVSAGAVLQFCDPGNNPSAITLTQTRNGDDACVAARTDGSWGGGFEACLEICEGGNCQPIGLKVIGKPKYDEITAISGELVCITDLLQMDQAPLDVQIQGGSGDLQLIPSGNNCFALVEPSVSYQTTGFQIIHTYLIFGETIYDTTMVTVPGKTVCDFEIFAEESFTLETNPVTQVLGAGEVLCLEGTLGSLLAATYTVQGQSVAPPTVGCDAFQIAKYSLRGLPRRWSDNGWRIQRYTKGGRLAFTNFYAATMNDVVAKIQSVDPSSTVTFDAAQKLLEIKGYTANPGALELLHLETNTTLNMQPLIVTGFESWALSIPAGLAVGEYEIAATNAEGCLDVAVLNVIEGSEKIIIRDTIYVSIEVNEPFAVCNLEGYETPSSEWGNIAQGCFVYTPDQVGSAGYQAFAKTQNEVTTEKIYVVTVSDRTCAPMKVAEEVEVLSSRCRSEYINLGLTRPDIGVTSSSGRVLSASQVTGTRAGAQYDFSAIPAQGLTSDYTVTEWTGVSGAQGISGNLQSILQQLREQGADVDANWTTNTITAGGTITSSIRLLEIATGAQIDLAPTTNELSTYGRFYGRTGNNSVYLTLGSCSDQMIARVKCNLIVWGGGSVFLETSNTGGGLVLPLVQIDMPDGVASWEIWQSPETVQAARTIDSSGIAFSAIGEDFSGDHIVLMVIDTAGTQYEVTVELKVREDNCITEVWREEGYELVADPYTGTTPFFFPDNFDRDQMQVFVNGKLKKGGFVKRDQVIQQTYSTNAIYSKISTPSGRIVDVSGSLTDAMSEVLAKAEEVRSAGQLSLANLEGETTLFGLDQSGIWQPMEPLTQKVDSRYALLMGPGEYEIELRTSTSTDACTDKVKVLVKSSVLQVYEESITVNVGNTLEWCIPETTAKNALVSIVNTCPGQSGEFASIAWNGDCVTIEGYELGTEYLCLKRSFLDGSVDSVGITLSVRSQDVLKLVPDHNEIKFAEFQILDVLSNDKMSDEPLQISLISEPFFGRAQVVGNSAIEYLHYGEDCEKDVFTYEVCQGDICDSTTVELDVICTELLVHNGISPNGDGLNDELTILGLGQYPDHVITIFNRQGNLIATLTEYENDWQGDVEGRTLPSGTYFYVIELGDGESKSGYIQISR